MRPGTLTFALVVAVFVATPSARAAEPQGVTSGAATNRPPRVTFSLSGLNYRFAVPEGFCAESGRDSEIAAAMAGGDDRNMTHFTIIPCEEVRRVSNFTQWGALKTPRASIGKRIPTRQQWVSDAKNNIKRRDLNAILQDEEKKLLGKTYKDVFGNDATVGTHMEWVDADEYAGYLAGTISIDAAGQRALFATAAGTTVVRGSVFFYYKYRRYDGLSDIAALLKQVRVEIRRFVTDNPE